MNNTQFPDNWFIYPINKEESDEMCSWRGGNYWGEIGSNCLSSDKWWSKEPKDGYTQITFKQFKKYVLKDDNESFPSDDFCVVVENYNGTNIIDFLISKGFENIHNYVGSRKNGDHYFIKDKIISGNGNPDVLRVYTLSKLKSLDSIPKKLIGYKVPFEIYITGSPWKEGEIAIKNIYQGKDIGNYIVSNFRGSLPKEIVEKWEPVYEEIPQYKVGDWVVWTKKPFEHADIPLNVAGIIENGFVVLGFTIVDIDTGCYRHATPEEIEIATTKVVRMGGENGFDLTIKNGQVYHKSQHSPITGFVKEIQKLAAPQSVGGYLCYIKDIIFSQTGCENKETKLSEWVNLYDQIK